MNKPLIIICLALAFSASAETTPSANTQPPASTGAPAQPAATPAGSTEDFAWNHGRRMDKIAQELGLSEQQKIKVQTILDEKHQKMQAIHDDARAKLQAVLTPEQFSKFDSLHPHRHLRWR